MITVLNEKCIGCGFCVSDCVAGYLYLKNGKVSLNESGCIACGHCFAICPQNAIFVDGMENGGETADMVEFDSETLLRAMKSRRTIRQFATREIEPEKVRMILEAGRYSPTGSNAQDVSYTILGSRQSRVEEMCVNLFRKGIGAVGKVSKLVRNMNIDEHFFFKGAPLVIVVSGRGAVNAALASSYMELMAESLGLGVLYSGFFIACTRISPKLRAKLELPKGKKAITCMVIGYPKVKYHRIPGRKTIQVREL